MTWGWIFLLRDDAKEYENWANTHILLRLELLQGLDSRLGRKKEIDMSNEDVQ